MKFNSLGLCLGIQRVLVNKECFYMKFQNKKEILRVEDLYNMFMGGSIEYQFNVFVFYELLNFNVQFYYELVIKIYLKFL